jgi:AraC-like DNA-binding protein
MSTTQHYRIEALDNLELLHTQNVADGYAKHIHEEYSLCWMEQGLVTTRYRGENQLSPIHSLTVMNPAELHQGEVVSDEAASYYSLYVSANTMQQLCEEIFEASALPYFGHPIVVDEVLNCKWQNFITSLTGSSLELNTHYVSFLAYLVKHYADTTLKLPAVRQNPSAIENAKAYLHTHFQKDITLAELANIANLNRAYLIRAFKKAVGLPPHAYQTQLRLSEAKKQLAKGFPIAQVALNTGFADQSHFSRTFKRTYGMTPGVYSRAKRIDDLKD